VNSNNEQLITALTYTCVFIHTSRYWEDYENMTLDSDALDTMKSWFISRNDCKDERIDIKIQKISQSLYKNLKTDWTIARALISNTIAALNNTQKNTIRDYIKGSVPTALKDDAGVTKAIDVLMLEL